MPYYRGSGKGYPHPERPGWTCFYVRNVPGLRVAVPDADAPKLTPFDLFQDKAGAVWCKSVLGKQKLICAYSTDWELYRHVQIAP